MSYKVLVCGSRDWTDRKSINKVFKELPIDTIIIHGAARGVDTLAHEYADAYGFKIDKYPANWELYGKRAGFIRNLEMLDQSPDLVLAFQKNKSRGTQH